MDGHAHALGNPRVFRESQLGLFYLVFRCVGHAESSAVDNDNPKRGRDSQEAKVARDQDIYGSPAGPELARMTEEGGPELAKAVLES